MAFLYEQCDCPFSCCCFWPCYLSHQVAIDTHVGCKREMFAKWRHLEEHSKTGDIYCITTGGHWSFGPVWSSCMRNPCPWSHIGIVYRKHDSYADDLCAEFAAVIDENPDETLFVCEAQGDGFTMNPLKPVYENLQKRWMAGYITIMPIKDSIREQIGNLEERFYETVNKLSEGSYQFNPCACVPITVDVWPCGCNCCCCELPDHDEDFDGEGVCTEYGFRVMEGCGYFEEQESDTHQTKYLKTELLSLPPEEVVCNELLTQTYLFDYDRQMVCVGTGLSVRAQPPPEVPEVAFDWA